MERDTSPERLRRYHELLRAQKPWERLQTAVALSAAVRQLAEAGLRARHPGAPPQELRMRLVVRLYGRATATRLFGTLPADAI